MLVFCLVAQFSYLGVFLSPKDGNQLFFFFMFYLFLFYNPNFTRDDPHLLQRCKQRVGLKRRAIAAFSPGPAWKENCPTGSPDVQPEGAATAVKPCTPSLLPLQCSQSPPDLQQAAAVVPAPSPSHHLLPVNNWAPCTPGLRLPAFPPLQPGTAPLQALGLALLPFWHPWFPKVVHAGSSLCSNHAGTTVHPNPTCASQPKP
ncbi:PREDICTED: uncharacterized protein LOC104294241 [Charadrius vociferus]|uniref:uncharacterized protein LOC104294241 n=1 Tax=Charadrius vociferus TaxID=50402 RepID=UPI0005216971|nr:PREDICTED: uncharacterized protein LOC104294241 [Charadrius vociferus]